jgi:hypothetical protein
VSEDRAVTVQDEATKRELVRIRRNLELIALTLVVLLAFFVGALLSNNL